VKRLEIDRQLDFAYSIPGLARFRVNVYFQRGARRRVPPDPHEIKSLDELGLPPSCTS
jgi:twitching motility protein PilT